MAQLEKSSIEVFNIFGLAKQTKNPNFAQLTVFTLTKNACGDAMAEMKANLQSLKSWTLIANRNGNSAKPVPKPVVGNGGKREAIYGKVGVIDRK